MFQFKLDMVGEDQQSDAAALLRGWHEHGDAQALELLFVEHVEPCLRDISLRTLYRLGQRELDGEDQAAEIRAEVMLSLTTQLKVMREQNLAPIRDLRAYLTSAVYNAGFMRLRARSPRRAQLHNRLRYMLRNDGRFALWESPRGMLAGLAKWAGQERTAPAPQLRFAPADLGAFLEKVFGVAQGPVAFAALANLAAEAMGIRDLPAVELQAAHGLAGPARALETEIDSRRRLAELWKEVRLLPAGQRAALLLNLRDANGQGVVELLPSTGVANFAELAAALNLSPSGLACIWNDLPLDDAAIAQQMGVTRQQVINLRKSARARLGRRLSSDSGNTGSGSPSNPAGRSLRAAGEAVRRLFGARGERP